MAKTSVFNSVFKTLGKEFDDLTEEGLHSFLKDAELKVNKGKIINSEGAELAHDDIANIYRQTRKEPPANNKFSFDELRKKMDDEYYSKKAVEMGNTVKIPTRDITSEVNASKQKATDMNNHINFSRNLHEGDTTLLGNAINFTNKGPAYDKGSNVIKEMSDYKNAQKEGIPKNGPTNPNYEKFKSPKKEVKQDPSKMDAFLKKAIPVTVGGGLIFSMFNRGGQMSNSELYGQQQQYGQ